MGVGYTIRVGRVCISEFSFMFGPGFLDLSSVVVGEGFSARFNEGWEVVDESLGLIMLPELIQGYLRC